jgi:NAD(P)-dependent dehydrogenase (short-subunit alcohol dehydrogenase family)
MTKPLEGRIALVTGGSRGVGAGIAQRLAADGATVAINYRRDAESAAKLVAEIEANGGSARAYSAAVNDPDAVQAMAALVETDLGPVDLLVSNAGTASRGRTIADTDPDEYLRLLNVHVLGPLALIRTLLPGMRTAQRADIVVISSTITTAVAPNSGPYAIAKAALEAAARTLAREERANHIRVNIVAPGLVATDMGDRLVGSGGKTIAELDPEYPFGRVARPRDVAGAVAFLVSADGEYLTGQRIQIDGNGTDPTLY